MVAKVHINQRNRPVQNSGKQGSSMHSNPTTRKSGPPSPCTYSQGGKK